MNLPVFDCLIDENLNNESGIYAISFVDAPANEVDFIALSAQKAKKEYLSLNSQKQILTGVVLQPDQLIYRHDPKMGEYYIKFSATEIEKIARKMMKTGIALRNTTHQHQNPLSGNYLAELWIVENTEQDKSIALGFAPQPKGTLMCSYKIEDKEYWDLQVMTGNVRGFSLEGFFFQQAASKIINQNAIKKMNNKQNKKEKSILSKLTGFFLDIMTVEKNDTTGSGTAYVIFTLTDGKEVLADADGFVTMDGEQLPTGEHLLADGNLLIVDEQGQFVETKEGAQKSTNPDETTANQTLSDKVKPELEQPTSNESTEALKSKIAELESKLAELAALAGEANVEVQKLRKVTPSTLPATALSARKPTEMKRHEYMAHTLLQTILNRKSN